MNTGAFSSLLKRRIAAFSIAILVAAFLVVVSGADTAIAAPSDQNEAALAAGTVAADAESESVAVQAAESMAVQATSTLTETGNLWGHDYYRWSQPTRSFLHVNAKGKLERVEYYAQRLMVEEISADYRSAASRKTIDAKTYQPSNLASGAEVLWGGFYSGSSNNYVVTGQENPSESNSLVVYRITKYTKDWAYVACAELKGANTYIPFDAGGCDMVESGGKLYVRTCHEMYESDDGLHHQANVQIVVDEASMTIDSAYTGVSNIGNWSGYVSHSFAQYITTLSGNVYGLDHGDAYPRAVAIKQLGGDSETVFDISQSYESCNNKTGVSVGGFESSKARGTLISAGNAADQERFAETGFGDKTIERNIWVGVTKTDLTSTTRLLTNVNYASETILTTPFLVKVNDDRFCVIWDEKNRFEATLLGNGHTWTVYYQFIDGNGVPIGTTRKATGALSDCQPVVFDGKIVWYAGWGVPSFYMIDAKSGAFTTSESLADAEVLVGLEDGQTYYNSSTGQLEEKMPQDSAATCPLTTVKLATRTLTEGVDYSLSYKVDHAKAQGTITVIGKGSFKGTSKVRTFPIMIERLSDSSVADIASVVYTGSAFTPEPRLTCDGIAPVKGVDYTVSYANNVNAGTAKVTVTGKGLYSGTIVKTFQIAKAKNTLVAKAKAKTNTVKWSKLKKKNQVIKKSKAFKVSKAKGKVTFKKANKAGGKKITVSKAGKVTVKKGLKKGTYKVKVKVTAKGNANYKSATKTVTLKIKVK